MRVKRYFRYLLFLSLLFIIALANVSEVNAMNTGFQVTPLPTGEKTDFATNVNIQLISEEPPKQPIVCFDVNDNGLIAIGQKTSHPPKICVYSSEGIFQYGYTFECVGNFYVEWDKETINIYFVRDDMIVSVNPSGKILDVCRVDATDENISFKKILSQNTQKTVNETKYYIRNHLGIFNLFASSYSQMVIQDGSGAENIIYDVNSKQYVKMVVTAILVCAFVVVAVVVVSRQFTHTRGRCSCVKQK